MSNPLMEARLVISADDKTSPVFKEIEARMAKIGTAGAQIGRMSAAISSGGMNVDRMARSVSKFGMNADNMRRLADSVGQIGRSFKGVSADVARASTEVGRMSRALARVKEAAAAAAPAIAAGVAVAGKQAVGAAAELQSERARLSVAGVPPEELAAADAQTAALAAKYPNVSRAAGLETYKELRSVLLHPEEAAHMLPTAVAAKSAMDALDKSGHLSEGLGFAVKGAEVLGLAQDPSRFAGYMDAFIRAQQVMGKTITPEQQYEFAKYVKASGTTLSDRFKMTTAVSLAQEMGGSTTGQSIDQFVKQIVGGFQGNNHSAAKEFVRLGLVNEDDFEKTKTGEIKGMKHGRKVHGASLAQTDPDQWVYQYFIPAMEKAGITSLDDQISEIRRSFPAGRASDLVAKLLTQRQSFENHAQLYNNVSGLQGGQALLTQDPLAGAGALGTTLQNLTGTALDPAMKPAAENLHAITMSLAELIPTLAAWEKQNPAAATAAAGWGVGAVGAASAYSAAALWGYFTGKGAPGLGGLGVGALGAGVAGSLAFGDAMGQDYLRERWKKAVPFLPTDEAARLKRGDLAPPSRGPLAGHWEHGRFIHDDNGYGRDFTLGSTGGFQPVGRLTPPGGFGYMSKYDASRVAPGPLGQVAATPQPVKLEGAADIALSVKIEASPELFRAIETARKVSASGALRANTGVSMSEAAPGR